MEVIKKKRGKEAPSPRLLSVMHFPLIQLNADKTLFLHLLLIALFLQLNYIFNIFKYPKKFYIDSQIYNVMVLKSKIKKKKKSYIQTLINTF